MDKSENLNPRSFFSVEQIHKRGYILRNGQHINLELGIPDNIVELILDQNFEPYINFKKGADECFKDVPEEKILKIIQRSNSISNIRILSKIVISEQGKSIVTDRLKTIQ